MAESLLRSWWKRFRGHLEPTPCPFAQASVLESRLRDRFAAPARILDAFHLAEGDRVLEIGPGVGYHSTEAMRRVGARGRLFCLDIQKEMLEEVRRRLSVLVESGASFIQGSATHLPLAGGSVDHVFLITVLGEIPDRPAALAEIRRVLCSGGRLSVSEQFPDPDFMTPRRLRRLLSAAGFIEETTRGFVVYTSTWRAAS